MAGWTLLFRGGSRASAPVRPLIGACSTRSGTSPRAAVEWVHVAGTAACPTVAPPTTTEGLRCGLKSAMEARRGMGTSLRVRGAPPVTAV